MPTGTITKFPITTIFEFADRDSFGLCPALCGEVGPIETASMDIPVSEAGIRFAINQAKIDDIAFVNLGDGSPVYAFSDDSTAYFYSLSAYPSDYITGYLDGNTVVLSGDGEELSSFIPVGYNQPLSVQGGRYQYGNTFEVSGVPVTGMVLANTVVDDCIAKMFIKCMVPVEPNGATMSIGIDGEPERYVAQFTPPSAAGLFTGWKYSYGLTAEHDWTYADRDIVLYLNGTVPVSGRMGVSIFYDQIEWPA